MVKALQEYFDNHLDYWSYRGQLVAYMAAQKAYKFKKRPFDESREEAITKLLCKESPKKINKARAELYRQHFTYEHIKGDNHFLLGSQFISWVERGYPLIILKTEPLLLKGRQIVVKALPLINGDKDFIYIQSKEEYEALRKLLVFNKFPNL